MAQTRPIRLRRRRLLLGADLAPGLRPAHARSRLEGGDVSPVAGANAGRRPAARRCRRLTGSAHARDPASAARPWSRPLPAPDAPVHAVEPLSVRVIEVIFSERSVVLVPGDQLPARFRTIPRSSTRQIPALRTLKILTSESSPNRARTRRWPPNQ